MENKAMKEKGSIVRQAFLALLTFLMAFTALTAWADLNGTTSGTVATANPTTYTAETTAISSPATLAALSKRGEK